MSRFCRNTYIVIFSQGVMGVPRFRLVTKAARGRAERRANVNYFTRDGETGDRELRTGYYPPYFVGQA
jgi:hypothetical protein